MKNFKATKVLFIKLGPSGTYEEDCIEKNNNIRLGYGEVEHQLCINKQWDKVSEYYTQKEKKTPSVATNHSNQIKKFYEEDENTLWITFYLNKLWWCFSKPEITLHQDNTKTRPVIGKWSDQDINQNVLHFGNLSGKLLKTKAFRGTICNVRENIYTLSKINGEKLKEVIEVQKVTDELKTKLTFLIQNLYWSDFETLIDLIFRQAGWQRVGATGKEEKILDLDLFAPLTGERAGVQIKAQSDLNEFLKYQIDFNKMGDYDKLFFVAHSPKKNLLNHINQSDTKLYFVDKIAELTLSAGLVDWIIKKTS